MSASDQAQLPPLRLVVTLSDEHDDGPVAHLDIDLPRDIAWRVYREIVLSAIPGSPYLPITASDYLNAVGLAHRLEPTPGLDDARPPE